jgi:hypothetical protein
MNAYCIYIRKQVHKTKSITKCIQNNVPFNFKIAIPTKLCVNNLVFEPATLLVNSLFGGIVPYSYHNIQNTVSFLTTPCKNKDIFWGLPYCHPLLQEGRIMLEIILYNNFD